MNPYSGLHPYPGEAGAGPGLSLGRPFFSGMSSCRGPWWVSPLGVGLTGSAMFRQERSTRRRRPLRCERSEHEKPEGFRGGLPLPCLARRSAHLIDPTPPGLRPPQSHLRCSCSGPMARRNSHLWCSNSIPSERRSPPLGRGQSWRLRWMGHPEHEHRQVRYPVESRAPDCGHLEQTGGSTKPKKERVTLPRARPGPSRGWHRPMPSRLPLQACRRRYRS